MEHWGVEPRWVVASESEAGLVNGYDFPSRLGADRWVAMIGARHHMLQRGPARPVLLVMVGTAVTVEAIDAQGRFLGGLIIPGHGIMLRALESGTAGLHVPTGDVVEFPTNTSDALTSGGTFAIAGACERMFQHLFKRCAAEPLCLMTGGAGWKMLPAMTRPFELIENLIRRLAGDPRRGRRWAGMTAETRGMHLIPNRGLSLGILASLALPGRGRSPANIHA